MSYICDKRMIQIRGQKEQGCNKVIDTTCTLIIVIQVIVYKMASLTSFVLLVAISTPAWSNAADNIRVSISTPTETVTEGGILALSCQVWNIQPDYTVQIFRELNSRTEQITIGEYISPTVENLNAFLATRTFSDGSSVHFVTVVDVSTNDQGKYICKVFDTGFNHRVEDSIDLRVFSYPGELYPLCSSIPNQPIVVTLGETITVKCTSETGLPAIKMKWMNNKSARYIADRNRTDGNMVHSEAILRIDTSLRGAVLSCEITSKGFPDWKRTCNVGPIKVHSNENHEVVLNDANKNKETNDQRDLLKPSLTGKCGKCSDGDMLQFYLTIATVGTGFLTIFFLTTTIILCYKYHHISAVTRREPSRVLTPQQSIEPVYVSLQRRSVNADREYMTLEDPNNPDNKIILPRETFDDYCRTMTLKRV